VEWNLLISSERLKRLGNGGNGEECCMSSEEKERRNEVKTWNALELERKEARGSKAGMCKECRLGLFARTVRASMIGARKSPETLALVSSRNYTSSFPYLNNWSTAFLPPGDLDAVTTDRKSKDAMLLESQGLLWPRI
jgi:hypothetical protein